MLDNWRLAPLILTALLFLPPGCAQTDRKAPPPRGVDRVETVEEHWPDGRLRLRREVLRTADGTLLDHGTYTRWHDNGQQEYQATFIEGQIHGVATRWHRNGQIWTEQHFAHGQRHGPRYTWDEAGRKRKEENYANDQPHGTWTVWDERGRVRSRQRFDHGTPVTGAS